MATPSDPRTARWVPLLVIGIVLNSFGLLLARLGTLRFLLMGAGVALILVAVVKIFGVARSMKDSSPDA